MNGSFLSPAFLQAACAKKAQTQEPEETLNENQEPSESKETQEPEGE